MLLLLITYAVWRCGIPVYVDWDKFHEADLKRFAGPEALFITLANTIIERGEYSEAEGRPYGTRTPGYCLFIAGFIKLFGNNWAPALAIFQASCIVFACIMAYISGASLRSPPVGAFAGFLVATYAPYHYISCLLLREPICLALFSLIMLLLIRRHYRNWSFIAMGLLIGITAMLREEFLLLFIPCCAAVIVGEFGSWSSIKQDYKQKWRKPMLKCAGIFALIILVFSPWIIRNAIVFKRFQMTGTLGGVQLYIGNNPTIRPFDYIYEYSFLARVPETKTHNDYEVGKIYQRRALKFIFHNPDRVIVNAIDKVRIVFQNSVNNANDFPIIFIGIFFGIFIGAHFKLGTGKILLLTTALTAGLYILIWRGSFTIGLLLPNLEFGILFRILGVLGFLYMIWLRKELAMALVFPTMFMVNIVFIPQHRHRWITDWLFMLWMTILLRDLAVYVINKQKNRLVSKVSREN